MNPPADAKSLNDHGALLARQGKIDEAAALVQQALSIQPDFAEAMVNLASLHAARFRYELAWPLFERALQLEPDFQAGHHAQAGAMFVAGRYEQTERALRALLSRWPNDGVAHANLATALRTLGRLAEAMQHYERALSLGPARARDYTILNRGMCRLFAEDYTTGLADYEARLKLPPLDRLGAQLSSQRWTGQELNRRTILVLHEQGLGDSIWFARFVQQLAARGATAILQIPQALVRLLRSLPGAHAVVAAHEPAPPHDFHVPMMSLAHLLGITRDSLVAPSAYLSADPALLDAWRGRIAHAAAGSALKIGIAWRGSDENFRNRLRSAALSDFAPLTRQRACFFSLQFGPAAAEARRPPMNMRLVDLTAELHDFADTAALIMNLDLVVTVDTATAHLAGALGQPVWNLLDAGADWRWLHGRSDSPWYPTMRLFRQSTSGDWSGVFSQVAAELERYPGGG